MTSVSKQELQIVQAFSSVDLPERILRESNIKELIHGMAAEQDAVQSDARRLERLRQEKKEGNIISNWWNDRDDKVQDAQIDLNKSIGRLTQKSSQLLIVNTAISKILNDQQRILLQQQSILKRQTDTLEEQNRKILEQQKLLEKQQRDINKANQGLMDAKGVTQEQAHKLVGCVVRVTEAEKKIDIANEALRVALEQHMRDSVAQCIASLNGGFAKQAQRHDALEQQFTSAFSAQSRYTQTELERFATESAQFKSGLGQQLELSAADLGKRHDALEQQLTSAFSAQSRYTQTELERFAAESVQFKSGLEQQLEVSVVDLGARHEALEQQITHALSVQSQDTQAELERFAAESAQFKSGLEQQLELSVADLGKRHEAFEQQLTTAFSAQSQHAAAELERFASSAADFKTSVEQQLQAHIQTVLEKAAAQDVAAQQLRETISAQLKKFQQDMVSAVEQKVLALRETVKGVEQKQETAQQAQTQALEAQRESLERSLQHLEADLSGKAETLKNAEAQLAALQAEQQKNASSNRLAIAAVACLALASLGWQVAQHFALV